MRILHYLFIIFFVAVLFPTFSGIPKIPSYHVFLYLALSLYLVMSPSFFVRAALKVRLILLLFLHLIYLLLAFYLESENRNIFDLYVPAISVLLLWGLYGNGSYQNEKRAKIILKLFVFGLICTACTTSIALIFFPDAARLLAGSLAESGNIELNNFFLLLGIGSYNFSVMWVFFIILFYFEYQRKRLKLWEFVFTGAIFLYATYKVSITAPFFLLFIGLSMIYFGRNVSSIFFLRLRMLFIASLVYNFSYLLSYPLYWAAQVFHTNQNVSLRLTNVAKRLDGTLANSTINISSDVDLDKSDVYIGSYEIRARKSIDSFFESPLIGGGEVGGHNFYLDILGSFGLVGFLAYVLVIAMLYKKASSFLISERSKILYNNIVILFVLLGLIKTYSLIVMFIAVFFVIPLYLKLSDRKYEKTLVSCIPV